MSNRLQGNLVVDGRLTPKFLTLPDQSVANDAVAADAAIGAEKLEHQHRAVYAQASDAEAAAETRVVHVLRGAGGNLVAFEAGLVEPCTGDATVSVGLTRNGVSVLSVEPTLDTGDAARATAAGTIDPSKSTLIAGDVLEVVVTVAAGTGALGSGVFASVTLHEDAN